MRELQQKQRLKQKLYSTPALIVLLVVTLLIGRGAYGVIMKERESAGYVYSLEEKVIALSDRQAKLKNDTSRLETDEGIDTEIKTRFSVAKAGEHVAVIVDPRGEASSTDAHLAPWYQKLWQSFKNLW
jgi:Tfp pilus assembly protein PilX